MQHYARTLSDRAEFSIVIAVAFGYFIFSSIAHAVAPPAGPRITDLHLQFLVVYESAVMLLLGTFLSLRGWSLARIGFAPNPKDTLIGFGLVAFIYLLYVPILTLAARFQPADVVQTAPLVSPGLSLVSVVLVSIVNPVFEELLVTAYVITALQRTRSAVFAINISVAIRLAYHLYQGAAGVITILPIGLVFAYWYARTGRVWPLVVAHAIFDFVGLMAYAG